MTDLESFLAGASIDDAVAALRPDYRALLIAVDGLTPSTDSTTGASDEAREALLTRAEATAQELLAVTSAEELPHVAAWREAYRAFGAKPQRTRNSLEALVRRAASGLPRVNPLTDIYNAISVLHQVPLGGEDMAAYVGAPRLVRATGAERFDTVADGNPVVEHPDEGEVVWRDDAGVNVPPLELAPGSAHPAHGGHHRCAVHPRCPRADGRRRARGSRRGARRPPSPARHRRPCRYSPRQIPDLTATSSLRVDLMPRRRGSRRRPERSGRGTGRSRRGRSRGR